jgi:hypothetical protein
MNLARYGRLVPLTGLLLLAGWVAACTNTDPSPAQSGGGAGPGGDGSAGSAGNASQGGSGSPMAGSGGAIASDGSGGAGAGAGGATAGGTSGGSSGAGGSEPGGSGGGGGEPPTGMCPTELPPLADQNDNSFYAERQGIPHGEIKSVEDKAGSNKTMRVYTPPGYETDTGVSYPVLYINHGGGENDSHWGCTSGYNCGYAGRILDNLLADDKAVPMIIAMPNTSDCANFNPPSPPDFADPCTTQYVSDFIPYIEQTYRV